MSQRKCSYFRKQIRSHISSRVPMVKLTDILFQENIVSTEIERFLQTFQFKRREHNAQDINEAASELSSIF